MSIQLSLPILKSLWCSGPTHAYAYPDTDSFLGSADEGSVNREGGSDVCTTADPHQSVWGLEGSTGVEGCGWTLYTWLVEF